MLKNTHAVKNDKTIFHIKKNILLNILKVVIAAGLLIFIVIKINFNEIISTIKSGNIALISAAFILVFANLSIQFTKWNLTTKTILKVNDKKKSFISMFYGISGGAFTPARIGDYFGRAIVYKDKSVLEVTIAAFVEKFFLLIMVMFWGISASILYLQFYYHVSFIITVFLFAALILSFYFIGVLLTNPATWENLKNNDILSNTRAGKWLQKLSVLKDLDKKYTGKMLALSFSAHVCYIIQFVILALAFSERFNILNYIWAANIVMFVKTIVPAISVGELGIREGVSAYFFSRLGSTAVIGFDASFFLYLINLLFPSLIGLLLLTKKNDV